MDTEVVKLNCEICYRQFVDRVPINAKIDDYPAFCHFCRGQYSQCDICLVYKKNNQFGDFYDFKSCLTCMQNYH